MRRGRVSPNNVLEEIKKVCVLGKGCGHLASASELNLGQFGAHGGASRRRVLSIPPFDHKSRGYITPFEHFPFWIFFFLKRKSFPQHTSGL